MSESYVGGAFFGKALPPKSTDDPRKVVRQDCLVWGKAAKDATDSLRKSRHFSFLIRYGEEPNPKAGQLDAFGRKEKLTRGLFMKCDVHGESTIASVLAAVEQKDMVMCLGRCTSRLQHTKKRGDMWFRRMKVDIIVPAGLIAHAFRLYSSSGIQSVLDAEDDEAPDVWED